jgi:hypothetical protein
VVHINANLQNFEKSVDAKASSIVFTSEYIAPWALPKEEIPIHLVWNPDSKFDYVTISVPPNMEITEFYNVESHEKVNSKIVIRKLKSPNFFGFVVILNEIIKKKQEKREIVVDFIINDKVQCSRSFTANICRPKLSVIKKPSTVVIRDDSDTRDLVNLSLKISGFGRIEITTELSVGGELELNVEPLYRETTRRLAACFRSKEFHVDKKKEIRINHVYVQNTTREFIDKIRKGELLVELKLEDLEDFKAWITDESNYTKMVELVSEQLETILIDSLLYYFDRYPTEGVELFGGSPTLIVERATQDVKMRFRYRDSLGNDYEPVQVDIPIEDLRTDKNAKLKVPINLKWVHEQLNPLLEGAKC